MLRQEDISKVNGIKCYSVSDFVNNLFFTDRRKQDTTYYWISGSKFIGFDMEDNTYLLWGNFINGTYETVGGITLANPYNFFRKAGTPEGTDSGLHILFDVSYFKRLICTYTEYTPEAEFLNKIFEIGSIGVEGSYTYIMKNPPQGKSIVMRFSSTEHKFSMFINGVVNTVGPEMSDNSIIRIIDEGVFNDYIQFQFAKVLIMSNDYHKRNRRKNDKS